MEKCNELSLGDDIDFANEEHNPFNGDDGTDDCPHCSGTGDEYEGDVCVGFCPSCGGSGILDT